MLHIDVAIRILIVTAVAMVTEDTKKTTNDEAWNSMIELLLVMIVDIRLTVVKNRNYHRALSIMNFIVKTIIEDVMILGAGGKNRVNATMMAVSNILDAWMEIIGMNTMDDTNIPEAAIHTVLSLEKIKQMHLSYVSFFITGMCVQVLSSRSDM